jgi:hypothetical protein
MWSQTCVLAAVPASINAPFRANRLSALWVFWLLDVPQPEALIPNRDKTVLCKGEKSFYQPLSIWLLTACFVEP